MKAVLSFNLPEEEEAHKDALNGSLFKFVLQDLDNELRGKIKYMDLPEAIHGTLQEIRDKLHELCNERDIDIWK